MTDVWFYHLEQQTLKQVLPVLVAKSLAQKIKIAIEVPAEAHLMAISDMLWAHDDVAFLPHGFGADGKPHAQPVWLTATAENANAATFRFYVEGALPQSLEGLSRAIILFHADDEQALLSARDEWKKRKAEGHAISYWKQDEAGKWQNLA